MKPSQRRKYPWEPSGANTPAVAAEPIRHPAIVAQVPRVALSGREASRALGVSFSTLETWRRSGSGPPSFTAPDGRRRLYPVAALVRWAADRASEAEVPADVQPEP